MPTPGSKTQRITPAHAKVAAKKEADAKRAQGVSAAVQQYMQQHPDEHVWASDIMNATGFTKQQVVNAIGYLRSQAGMTRIAIIRPGNAWRYRSAVPAKVVVPAKERVVVSAQADPEPGVPAPGEVRILQVLPDDSLIMTVGGKDYHAKPIR